MQSSSSAMLITMKPTTREVLSFIVHHDSGTFALRHGDG
jgi:hypothetical protein